MCTLVASLTLPPVGSRWVSSVLSEPPCPPSSSSAVFHVQWTVCMLEVMRGKEGWGAAGLQNKETKLLPPRQEQWGYQLQGMIAGMIGSPEHCTRVVVRRMSNGTSYLLVFYLVFYLVFKKPPVQWPVHRKQAIVALHHGSTRMHMAGWRPAGVGLPLCIWQGGGQLG